MAGMPSVVRFVTNIELKDDISAMEARVNAKIDGVATTIRWGISVAVIAIPAIIGACYALAQGARP